MESGADVSSIPEPVLRQLEARRASVAIGMPLEKGARKVRPADDRVVTVTHETVSLRITVLISSDPVVVNLEL